MNNVALTRDTVPAPLATRDAEGQAAETHAVPLAAAYLRIALRWKWLILAAVAVASLAAVILTLITTPMYTATTRLEISREGSQIVEMSGVEPKTSAADMEFYQTQYGLLKSRSLAERVARELRLPEDARFFALFGREDLIETTPQGAAATANSAERLRVAANILLAQIEVTPVRLSRLADVSWTSPDPDLSARVANAWAQGFIQSNLERRFEATAYARRFLEQRLEQVRRRLEESERQLVGYASNQAIINIPIASETGTQTQERSLTAESLSALNAALSEATADRVRAESRLRQAGGSSAEALTNPTITMLRQRRAEAAAEYSRLMTQFEPQYPPAQALQAQIQQLDRSLAREEARVGTALRSAYEDSVQRESALSGRVEGLKQDFLDLRRRSIQYNIYQRDVDTNRELYNGLLQRYKEIGVAGGVGSNNVAIVDGARVPQAPSQPRPLINLMLGILLGLGAGVGLALIREQMDETISDPTDVEKRIGLPLLGAIPNTGGADPGVEVKDPKSGLTEAYLSVQTSLAFSSDHGIPRSLVVTSTRPAEGKSITAYAIAHTIGRSGAKTILVDGDMRSPSVHHNLDLTNEKGLSNYLAGTEGVDSLIQYPQAEHIAVLTAGPQPPNAAELLRGARLEALLAELLAKFEHVIIDAPPIMGLADAPIIASRTEGTIFVVEAQAIKARVARRAIDRLRQARARLVGSVVTKFDARRTHFGYGYDYGYGYGYGRTYGDKAEKAA